MKFETLTVSHSRQLLAFEVENREWFERMIAPRDNEFYSEAGVLKHIETLGSLMQKNLCRNFVAIENEIIIARANLKSICKDSRSAEVGYRVAMTSIGAGVGTACVEKLINEAVLDGSIDLLRGNVLDNNPASRRVLEKNLFKPKLHKANFYEINGVSYGCTVFERLL